MSMLHEASEEKSEQLLRKKILTQGLQELVAIVGQDQLKSAVLALGQWELKGFHTDVSANLSCDLPEDFVRDFRRAFSNGYVNIALTGPAHTGMSRAAEILPKILYGFDLIQYPTFKRVSWSSLSTWDNRWHKQMSVVEEIFTTLRGGILVIDPVAPQNFQDPNSMDRRIIHEIATQMISHKDILVIMVGSEKVMQKIYTSNPVLKTCIALKIHFSSYTPSQLIRVVEDKAHVNFFSLCPRAKEFLLEKFTQLVLEDGANIFETYGNALFAQEIVTRAAASHQRRWANDHLGIPFYQYVDQYVQYWHGDTELSVEDIQIGLEDSINLVRLCA